MAEISPESVLDTSTLDDNALLPKKVDARIPGLTILAHPDSRRVGERVALAALSSDYSVALSRIEPRFAPASGGEARPLADLHLSRAAVGIAPDGAADGFLVTRGEVRTGVEVDGAELESESRFGGERLDDGITLVLAGRVALLLHTLERRPRDAELASVLIGESAAIAEVRRQIRQVAAHAVTVLLRGETGTGKELVARSIHDASPRRAAPWVALNMGAVPPSLAAAELFGAARGAYTGATRTRRGYFQRAAGGTLFLDEIGETPCEVQPVLLRALETGEVQPVGAAEAVAVDARVIAATDVDLEAEIGAGRFRAPLLHRLGGYQIRLPALRQRRDDVGRLLFHFLRQELAAAGEEHRLDPVGPGERPWLSAPLVARLARYHWPGNVRQLRNLIRQLVIGGLDAAEGERQHLVRELLPDATADRFAATGQMLVEPPATPKAASYRQPREVCDEELIAALRATRFRLQPAARRLGVSRTSLYALIDRCDQLRRASQLERQEIEACRDRHADLDAMAEELQVSRHGLQQRLRELEIRGPGAA